MWKGINGDIAGTLDSNYFKGCGEREGLEREIVYWVNDELSGSDNPYPVGFARESDN